GAARPGKYTPSRPGDRRGAPAGGAPQRPRPFPAAPRERPPAPSERSEPPERLEAVAPAPAPAPTPAAPARITTGREWLTLTGPARNGRAPARTERPGDEETVECAGIPAFPAFQPGQRCRADITRENGKPVRAVFKGWR